MTPDEEALKYVNSLRTGLGWSPLEELCPGNPGEVGTCPIAMSLRDGAPSNVYAEADVTEVTVGDPCGAFLHDEPPLPVQEFIAAFDAGDYPELEA